MTQPKNLPLVNLNGTSRETLEDQVGDVYDAAIKLRRALLAATPHGRDYPHAQDTFQEVYSNHARYCGNVAVIEAWALRVLSNLQDQDVTPNQRIIRDLKQKG